MSLTKEDLEVLSAPVPKHEIKSYEGRGGKEMRYTSVEFVEGRLAEVDPSFGKDVELGTKGITVHYTVKGVRRGDAFDYDSEGKFGTPVTNGLARACRRAARMFGVAKELWEDAEDDSSSSSSKSSSSRSSSNNSSKSSSSNGTGSVSERQIKYLKSAFGVPENISKKLTPGREGTASALIEALNNARKEDQDEYDDDPTPHIRRALKKIAPKLLPLLVDEDENDDDED